MAGNAPNTVKAGRGLLTAGMTAMTLAFLILPLVVMVAYSFNSSRVATLWEGFSLKWYAAVLQDRTVWEAVKNSLVIAVANTAVSVVLGTMAALALGRQRFSGQWIFAGLLYTPMILPELIFGLALLILFVALGFELGFISVIIAHATFSIPFVAVEVLSKVRAMDPRLEEAGLDLGATPWQAFRTVLLPQLSPGIIAGALFAFTMSLDDFVITYFTAGSGLTTLPLRIYAMVKTGISPGVNAVSTLLIGVTILVILVIGRIRRVNRVGRGMAWGLRTFALSCLLLLAWLTFQGGSPGGKLYISNYSEYLSRALIEKFEKRTGIEILEDYYSGNEELLAKMQMKAGHADLVVVTDYMVKIMIRQGLLAPLSKERLPNLKHIPESFRHPAYDPGDGFHVPYTYGFTGIAYNTATVPEPPTGWQVLSDPRYSQKIMLLDEMIEVLDIGFRLNGFTIGDRGTNRLEKAVETMISLRPAVKTFSSTLAADYLAAGEVDLAQTWNGAFYYLKQEHPGFEFVVPEEGSFSFVDTFCIPASAKNKANAHQFINFMLDPENAARNMTDILYLMPNTRARAFLDEKTRALFESARDAAGKTGLVPELGAFKREVEKAWTRYKTQGG